MVKHMQGLSQFSFDIDVQDYGTEEARHKDVKPRGLDKVFNEENLV